MDGFTHYKSFSYHVFYHLGIEFGMMIYADGSGDFFHFSKGESVHVPTVAEINLGGFPNPQTFDNIRHDLVHVWYWLDRCGTLSPNHEKLLGIADTPLWRCHWEEYKVESLEHYIRTGEKREDLDCYERAKAFIDWVMNALDF